VTHKRIRSGSGSLAGWLFADLAIVLAIAFLQSSIDFSDARGDKKVSSTTTTTEVPPQSLQTGVSIEPCEIKFLRVTNLNNNEEIKAKLISEISKQTTCSQEEFYGVVLIFAGNADTNDDEDARARAGDLCESLFETWVAMKRLSTYCEGFKNDGIDSDYFNLTLFPYVPNP